MSARLLCIFGGTMQFKAHHQVSSPHHLWARRDFKKRKKWGSWRAQQQENLLQCWVCPRPCSTSFFRPLLSLWKRTCPISYINCQYGIIRAIMKNEAITHLFGAKAFGLLSAHSWIEICWGCGAVWHQRNERHCCGGIAPFPEELRSCGL